MCALCRSPRRDATLLCVVETPADLAMVEQTLSYSGMYFVLMGRLSPLDGVGPRDIGLDRLLARAADGEVQRGDPRHQFHQRGRGDRALHRRDAARARLRVTPPRARRAARRRARVRRRRHHLAGAARPARNLVNFASREEEPMTLAMLCRWPAARRAFPRADRKARCAHRGRRQDGALLPAAHHHRAPGLLQGRGAQRAHQRLRRRHAVAAGGGRRQRRRGRRRLRAHHQHAVAQAELPGVRADRRRAADQRRRSPRKLAGTYKSPEGPEGPEGRRQRAGLEHQHGGQLRARAGRPQADRRGDHRRRRGRHGDRRDRPGQGRRDLADRPGGDHAREGRQGEGRSPRRARRRARRRSSAGRCRRRACTRRSSSSEEPEHRAGADQRDGARAAVDAGRLAAADPRHGAGGVPARRQGDVPLRLSTT